MQHSFTRPPSPPPYIETSHRGQQGPGRDPDFWFEDGNVVVIADNTSFRIHRSVLARHSDLLVDRMGSHHDHRDTTSDGCPIVRIADSASTFKGLLSLLYPGPSAILRHVASDRVLPRVTHKYLHGLLPATFDEWKRREDRALSPSSGSALRGYAPNPDMIGVLTALRQIHADDLLPIALYLCAQLPPRVLLAGTGSGAEQLSRGDVERCLVLRAALAKHAARMAMRLFADGPGAQCHQPRTCRRAVEETFGAVVEGQFEDAPRTDPLGAYWRRQLEKGLGERGAPGDHEKGLRALCARCAGVLRERDEEQRRELWDELPRLVGF